MYSERTACLKCRGDDCGIVLEPSLQMRCMGRAVAFLCVMLIVWASFVPAKTSGKTATPPWSIVLYTLSIVSAKGQGIFHRKLGLSNGASPAMSGSFALRKLLFDEGDQEDVNRRGYHYSGAYASLLHPVAVLQPAAVLPKSGLPFASFCLALSFTKCLTMKVRNKEKWWMGMFAICTVYYSGVKAHKVDNGLVGHQSGFFAAGMGAVGCVARLMARSGSVRRNLSGLGLFTALLWYELGRYHLWAEHATELRREMTPERSYDLLGEYVPQSLEIEFLPYRSVA